MRRWFFSLIALAAVSVAGQSSQSGTPAKLEVKGSGKSVNVFLQRVEGDNLIFQAVRSAQDRPAPADKIESLTFYPKHDAVALEETFNDGDYSGVIALYGRALAPYWEYMLINNNVREELRMMVKSYFETGDLAKVGEAAALLQKSPDAELVMQGQAYAVYMALSTTNFAAAEAIQSQVESQAAGLYLQAVIERAKGNHRSAIKLLTEVIASYGNDMNWMPESELLSAKLYLDMARTNSAATTARQVEKIYGGTSTANAAKIFAKSLPEVEQKTEK